MKKYIKVTYISCFVATITIISIFMMGLFYNTKLYDIKQNLNMGLNVIETSKIPDNIDLNQYAKDLSKADKDLRVTIIDIDGNVLGDSEIYPNKINHLDRKEVIDAVNNAKGEDIRFSESTKVKTIYIAKQITDNIIIRFAYPLVESYNFLKIMIPLIICISIFMLFFINKFASNFSNRLLIPLENISLALENRNQIKNMQTGNKTSFKEIEPIINNIDYLIRKLNYDFEEMEKTKQLRTDFVANVSHELKSPLTSIKGFAELIHAGLVTTKEKEEDYLDRIIKESDRLLNIINDILYLSETESIPIDKSQLVKIDLKVVALDVAKSLESLRAGRNITLVIKGEGTIFAIEKDIWEIIYNLVNNAIKYGKDRGTVQIEIGETSMSTYIIVRDDGIGISQEYLPRIFERFYRVDKSRSRKSGGTGLGLSIVKNMVMKYHAVVTVKSDLGIGSEFKVEFFSRE